MADDIFRANARRTALEGTEIRIHDDWNAVTVTAPFISYGGGAVTITTTTARKLARKHIPNAVLRWQSGTVHGRAHVWHYAAPVD